MSATKLLLVLPLVVALGYLALVGLMYFSQRALLYPGAGAAFAPASRAEWGEKVSIATPDGETLHALYSKGKAGNPSVLFFLGNADRVGNYGFLAPALAARGIGLLAISYRGYPGSTGSPSESGLLTDGLAAFDWLSARSEGQIVVLGQSLGSGVAVNTAAQRPAAGVVLVSAYPWPARRHHPAVIRRGALRHRSRAQADAGSRRLQPQRPLERGHDRRDHPVCGGADQEWRLGRSNPKPFQERRVS